MSKENVEVADIQQTTAELRDIKKGIIELQQRENHVYNRLLSQIDELYMSRVAKNVLERSK